MYIHEYGHAFIETFLDWSCAEQIMSIQNGQLLCEFVIIWGLLQAAQLSYAPHNGTTLTLHHSISKCQTILHHQLTLLNGMFPPCHSIAIILDPFAPFFLTLDWFLLHSILIDLAPLKISFPLLILFNFSLASGPALSFIFFYQADPAAIPALRSYGIIVLYSLGSGFMLGLLTMQSPITDLFWRRSLPYLALQYCKVLATVLAVVATVVLGKRIDCPCASWRCPWAKRRRSACHFRERLAQRGQCWMDYAALPYSHTASSINLHSLFSSRI